MKHKQKFNTDLHKKSVYFSAIISISLASCANIDPLENVNRKIFNFNEHIDVYALKPIAESYYKYTPQPIKSMVKNAYANIEDIYSIANNVLQAKPKAAAEDTMRVAINTVLGIGGLIDIASKAGIPRYKEDLGQTLGYWGIPNGPYLILPILGPSTLRDTVGTVAQTYTSVLGDGISTGWKISYHSLNIIQIRANLLDVTNNIDSLSLDKYTFIRSGYLQKRNYDVYDGDVPEPNENFE